MISLFSFKEKNTPGTHLPVFLQPIEIDAFLEEHGALIKRLKLAYSERSSWETRILPCVRELALVCGHLPYTSNGIFSDVDGLFKASITAATYAIEIMESSVQLEKNIMAQHLLQNRLKAAAALAALCAFLDVFDRKITIREKVANRDSTFFHISETNHVEHLAFEPLAMPYVTWAQEKLSQNPTIELELLWNPTPPLSHSRQMARLFYARHVLLPETLAWLSNAGRLPLTELLKCLTAESTPDNLPSSVIRARNLGVYRACLLERERIGAKLGEVLSPEGWQETLVRILRARILNDWEVNAKDSPLRKGADGLFLFWPDVCPILLDDMKTFGLTDLPTDPDIWAGCLINSGITMISQQGTSTCWIAVTPNAKPREAIKLSDSHFFMSGQLSQAKAIKRNFETKLPSEQSSALSQLTREILESVDKPFTQKLPTTVHQRQELFWRVNDSQSTRNSNTALLTFAETLNRHPNLTPLVVIDEGLFLSEEFPLPEEQSFERLVTSLLTANLLCQTERQEPLWVTQSDANGKTLRGVILKPDCIEGVFQGKALLFNEAFEFIHHRSPTPHFSFMNRPQAPSDQLSLNFDEGVNHA